MITRIKIRDSVNAPSHFLDADGGLYFDTDKNFFISNYKRITQLNLNKLEFDYQVSGSLQNTKKNSFIAEYFSSPLKGSNKYKPISIDIIQGSRISSDNQLEIQKIGSTGIEVVYALDRNHWALQLSRLTLRDLDLGTYTHIQQTILDPSFYTTKKHYVPFLDYGDALHGGFLENGEIIIGGDYLRPVLFDAGLLAQMFCQVGHVPSGDLLDDEDFKRDVSYFFDQDYGTYKERVKELNVVANIDSGQTLVQQDFGGADLKMTAETDISGLLVTSANDSRYLGNGIVDATISVDLSDLADDQETIVQLIRVADYSAIRPFDRVYKEEVVIGQSSTTVSFKVEDIALFNVNSLRVRVLWNGDSPTIGTGKVVITGKRIFLRYGEEYDLNKLLMKDISCLDFLKAKAFQYGLKFYTSGNTVFIAPSYSVGSIEGYYKEDTHIELQDLQYPLSELKTMPSKSDQKRFIKVQYQNSSDGFISKENLEEPLYSRIIDLGDDYNNDETLDLICPLYEPTANSNVQNILEVNFDNYFFVKTGRLSGDSDLSQYGFNTKPRNLKNFGFRRGLGFVSGWSNGLNTFTYPYIPIACQEPVFMGLENTNSIDTLEAVWELNLIFSLFYEPQLIGQINFDPNFIEWTQTFSLGGYGLGGGSLAIDYPETALENPDLPELPIVATLYEKYLQRFLQEEYNEAEYNVLVKTSEKLFQDVDFRSLAVLSDNGLPALCRILEIRDFTGKRDEFIPWILKKTNPAYTAQCGVFNNIDIDDGNTGVCNNYPVIAYTKDSNCFDLSIAGNYTSTVDTITYQWREQGSATWINLIGAQICDKLVPFEVRALVTWTDACADNYTPIKLIYPCNNNEAEIIVQGYYDSEGDYYLKAFIGGNIIDTYIITSFTQNAVTYTENTQIGPFGNGTEVTFLATVNFDDACSAIDLTKVVTTPLPNQPCSTNSAQLILTNKAGTIDAEVTGTWIDSDPWIIIWYKEGIDGRVKLWQGKPVGAFPTAYFKALVRFKNGCPDIFIDWTNL